MHAPHLTRRLVPAAGAAVMGTAIVSIALSLDHLPVFSDVLLAVGAAFWLGLVLVFAARAVSEHMRWREDACSPASLTAVAGTVVLGSRIALLGDAGIAEALLVLGLAVWLALLLPVLRHWRTPTVGVSFMLTVATESLAALAALLAYEHGIVWLALASLAPLALGLAAYGFVLWRFDLRQLLVGAGDQWVAGGALAIATLACAQAAAAFGGAARFVRLEDALAEASLVLWALAAAWLPLLVVTELRAPRLVFDVRRWATVFPLGMYAASSFAVADVTGHAWLTDFARVWIWAAVAVWALVLAGAARRAARDA